MKKHISFLLVLLLFSCEMIVDVDVPFEQPQLVLNSFFNPDSLWSAKINLNRHILSELPYVNVENANVVVYQNDLPIDTLIHRQNGFYESKTNKPLVDTEYEIRASAPGYETIIGKSKIPKPAQIKNVEIEQRDATASDGQSSIINVTFNDNGAEINYYEIMVFIQTEWYSVEDDAFYTDLQPVEIESNDQIDVNNETYWDGGIIFRDILFNGKEAELSVNTKYRVIQDSETVVVWLQTLSEDCSQYKRTTQLQFETSGDPFAQPVNVSNNIENGFGVFAGYSQSTFDTSGPKPIITGITPAKAKVGDHVIISGKNLLDGFVLFKAGSGAQVAGEVVWSTESEIEVIVPMPATTGKIVIYTRSGVAVADFEVIN